jgi:ankyrin repeat protein
MTHSKATTRPSTAPIKSLPIDVLILIIEILRLKDARKLCDALRVPEQVAVQYCYIEKNDIHNTINEIGLKHSCFKFLLKNKRFQIKASSNVKTLVALFSLDLEFSKNCIEEFKPDLNYALLNAVQIGFTDAVKLLLSYSRVDPSAKDNEAIRIAAIHGEVEIVYLLLSDSRLHISEEEFDDLIYQAKRYGQPKVVECLKSSFSRFLEK